MIRFAAALLALLMAMIAMPVTAAEPQFITIETDNGQVFVGDAVVIEVRFTGLHEPVDFSILDQIGERVRETAGTMVEVISGKVVDIQLRRIEMVLKGGAGPVVIGPLTAGDVASNSLVIDVREPVVSDWRPGAEDLRLTVSVKAAGTLHVQQQMILDIELLHRYPVADEGFTLPSFDGFDVVPVFVERRTIREGDSGWRSIAWRYALFPKRSGKLTLDPVAATGSIIRSRHERVPFSLRAAASPVEVLPAEANAGAWWLPARSVTMTESWGKPRDAIRAGDETERIITVTAEGARGEQIPDIAMAETRGLMIAPLGAKRSTEVDGDGVRGTAEFRWRVRALSPVPVFPDTIRLPWWDTTEDRLRDAIVPALRLEIGMPDREGLLALVGAQRGWLERLSEQAATLAGTDAILIAAGAAFLLAAALGLGPMLNADIGGQYREWLALRRLNRLMARGLYSEALDLLLQARKDRPLSPEATALVSALESAHFGEASAKPATGRIGSLRPTATGRMTIADALPRL